MPKVFIVDPECESALKTVDMVERNDSSARYATTLEEAMVELKQAGTDLLLLDTNLPDGSAMDFMLGLSLRHAKRIVLCGEDESVAAALKQLRSERVTFARKPLSEAAVHDLLLKDRQKKRRKRKRTKTKDETGLDEFLIGKSKIMAAVRQLVLKVAPTEATVLVVGDSGTGKELVAQAIHANSGRSGKPFEAINCGAIPENLLESELFGHMKGSFTGADRNRAGIFERANGGTLFLDEVTEMAPEMQVRLLRVLETMVLRRVGGEKEISVDVRVVAATNRNPEQAVEEGKLREDLMYRLAVFQIDIPPLREREDDVVQLAKEFLSELNTANGTEKKLTSTAVERLHQYHWPGNVRQLRNVINRGYILAKESIDLTYLLKLIRRAEAAPSPDHSHAAVQPENGHANGHAGGHTGQSNGHTNGGTNGGAAALENEEEVVVLEVGTSIDDAEKELIFKTLDEYDGDKKKAAQVLGISLKTLYNRLNEYEQDGGHEVEENGKPARNGKRSSKRSSHDEPLPPEEDE